METLKKLDNERVEVTSTIEPEIIQVEKKDIIKEIEECEETIKRNKRWLKEIEK